MPLISVPLLDNYIISYKHWNHLDFLVAISANYYQNQHIFHILEKMDKKLFFQKTNELLIQIKSKRVLKLKLNFEKHLFCI